MPLALLLQAHSTRHPTLTRSPTLPHILCLPNHIHTTTMLFLIMYSFRGFTFVRPPHTHPLHAACRRLQSVCPTPSSSLHLECCTNGCGRWRGCGSSSTDVRTRRQRGRCLQSPVRYWWQQCKKFLIHTSIIFMVLYTVRLSLFRYFCIRYRWQQCETTQGSMPKNISSIV